MRADIQELIAGVEAGDGDAASCLALLLERATTASVEDSHFAAVLPSTLADLVLTEDEVSETTQRLTSIDGHQLSSRAMAPFLFVLSKVPTSDRVMDVLMILAGRLSALHAAVHYQFLITLEEHLDDPVASGPGRDDVLRVWERIGPELDASDERVLQVMTRIERVVKRSAR